MMKYILTFLLLFVSIYGADPTAQELGLLDEDYFYLSAQAGITCGFLFGWVVLSFVKGK